MAKDAYYFSHDSNARYDPKILAMRAVYGMEGYGRYWCLIEILRDEDGYRLKKTKHLYDALAMQMQCERNATKDFVDACINEFGLLCEDDNFIWSESLIARMENKDKKSEKARKAAHKRWQKTSDDAGSMQPHSECNADAMQMQSERNALKERKVKESKRKESTKRSRRANKFDDKQMALAKKMLDLIKTNIPNYKAPASLDGWANEIRLMMERDQRTIEQIDYLINWSQHDPFWLANCLSPSSLRKHFDQMIAQCKKQKQTNRPRDGNIVSIDKKKQEEYEHKYGF